MSLFKIGFILIKYTILDETNGMYSLEIDFQCVFIPVRLCSGRPPTHWYLEFHLSYHIVGYFLSRGVNFQSFEFAKTKSAKIFRIYYSMKIKKFYTRENNLLYGTLFNSNTLFRK